MQKAVAVPRALVQTTYDFQSSAIRQIWQLSRVASSSSITEICFRIVNLRAALRQGDPMDRTMFRNMALDIDGDLEDWRAGLPSTWRYSTIHGPARDAQDLLQGVRHMYATLWIAEAWNNWRTLRLLVNQMLDAISVDSHESVSLQDLARQLCTDVCISVFNFAESPSESGHVAMCDPCLMILPRLDLPDSASVPRRIGVSEPI